jgi:lipopolysaccharide transport system ATP-binding protein
MSDVAIRAERLGKQYTIGRTLKSHDRLGDQLVDWILTPLKRTAGLLRQRSGEPKEILWALRNVSFEISRGEIIGIVGRNGAGKSTLLKILSRITEPTEGSADIQGRIGSLLEVGTGFHPELTGRENVFLNGAILGMRKPEIKNKFDAIIDFAEIDRFVDTPVKHYSSGMYVRLAFAVAAHLEPEILLVDEVLAVGDIAFQKKCLGKMDAVSKEGRTILFVSHNMNAIQRLCPKSILLGHGKILEYGDTAGVVERYLSSASSASIPNAWIPLSQSKREGVGKVRFEAVLYRNADASDGCRPYPGASVEFLLDMVSNRTRSVNSIAVTFYDRYGTKLINMDSQALRKSVWLREGRNIVRFKLHKIHLNPGIYNLGLWVADPPAEVYDSIASAIPIEIEQKQVDKVRVQNDGLVPCDFELEETFHDLYQCHHAGV